jgi:hypothetical protein
MQQQSVQLRGMKKSFTSTTDQLRTSRYEVQHLQEQLLRLAPLIVRVVRHEDVASSDKDKAAVVTYYVLEIAKVVTDALPNSAHCARTHPL